MSEYLSIGGVCRLLGISLSTAYRRIKTGTIVPAFRTSGGHRRFELMTVFCARLYGKRSHRNKKMFGGMDSALQC